MSDGFFVRHGDVFTPTGLGKSPWDAAMQGGGPICGLLGQLAGAVPTQVAMLPERLTVDLFGTVPMIPLEVNSRILRDGKRLQIAEVTLHADGRVHARATLLRSRLEASEFSPATPERPFPAGLRTDRRTVAESIRVAGAGGEPGHGALWMRVITPLIVGEPIDPLGSLAMAADWGTTVSPPVSPHGWAYPSLDISLHLLRLPHGDWWLLDGESEMAGSGSGVARLRLSDVEGRFGHVHQCFLVQPRMPSGIGPDAKTLRI